MFTGYKDVHSLNERTDRLINEREEEGGGNCTIILMEEYINGGGSEKGKKKKSIFFFQGNGLDIYIYKGISRNEARKLISFITRDTRLINTLMAARPFLY